MKPRITERNTRQKETVRSVFMQMRSHPTAESVVEEVRRADPSIGRATVYRYGNNTYDDRNAYGNDDFQ